MRSFFALLAMAPLLACGPQPAGEAPPPQAGRPEAPPPALDLPDDPAGRIVRRAIDHHGGWDAWARLRTLELRKTTTRYGAEGTVERRMTERHRYVLRPELKVRIDREADGQTIVLINSGGDAWKTVDGRPAATPEDRNQARNSTFGSHYVFNMPWKLADPGVHLSHAGQETLADGTVVDKVRVTYEEGAGDAGGLHTWTYWFDAETGRLTANHLQYEPGKYDFTEYHDDVEIGGLRFASRRLGYKADGKGRRGPRVSEIVYEDIRLDVPLEESVFQRP